MKLEFVFNLIIFQLFYLSNLSPLFFLFEIIYESEFFFNFNIFQFFLSIRFDLYYLNKLKKKIKTLKKN